MTNLLKQPPGVPNKFELKNGTNIKFQPCGARALAHRQQYCCLPNSKLLPGDPKMADRVWILGFGTPINFCFITRLISIESKPFKVWLKSSY